MTKEESNKFTCFRTKWSECEGSRSLQRSTLSADLQDCNGVSSVSHGHQSGVVESQGAGFLHFHSTSKVLERYVDDTCTALPADFVALSCTYRGCLKDCCKMLTSEPDFAPIKLYSRFWSNPRTQYQCHH